MKMKIRCTNDILLPEWLKEEFRGNQLLATILWQRGLDTPEKVRRFLDHTQYIPTDPFEFPQMPEAVELVLMAIEEKQRICVYGDYDVDGVTSTAILVTLLQTLEADVCYHVPNRFTEGYGMSGARITRLVEEGVQFILTCDCGISNKAEIELARSLGLIVLVTDHHQLPDCLPPANAIVTPKLLAEEHPAADIPGAGMAYFLARAILQKLGREAEADEYLDLVALAVVADIVTLQEENRYLLQKGLPVLAYTHRPGLQELCKVCGIEPSGISEEEIAFQLAPRLNAAGRMRSAELSVNLLLCKTEEEARPLARELDHVNSQRKEVNDQMYEEVLNLLGPKFQGQPIISYQPHWHEGVLGITASKLVEDYHIPVLLMCEKKQGQIITGSARSIEGIHIFEQLKKCAQFLRKFGGHAGAAGFSLHRNQLDGFRKSMEKILSEEMAKLSDTQEIVVDSQLALNQVNQQMYLALKKLAPFGEGNRVPVFLAPEVEVVYHRPTTNDKHLRLVVKHEDTQHPAIWWWGGQKEIGRTVDLVYSIGLNKWHDKEELQLVVSEAIVKTPLESEIDYLHRPEFEVTDYRNWRELGKSIPDFPEALYFHEGLEPLSSILASGETNIAHSGRYHTYPADCLVLISCPPGLRVLRELVLTVRPAKVVLAYGDLALEGSELVVFVKKLLAIVKTVVTDKHGRTNIYQLALLTGEMENVVVLGLRYLQEKGLIDFDFSTLDQLFIQKGDGQVKPGLLKTEVKLQTLLQESRAFRNYLLKKETPQIKTLVTG